ncbi:MAG TPA: copper resistance CopC family protein [Pseudonocardiaceae bacterium]|nr:copper resistance CopC family protein [Pseudonocardiaceae bacterium]
MRENRPGRRLVTAIVVAGLFALNLDLPAQAHNVLISADPGIGSRITTGPEYVSVTFGEPVQYGFTELGVLGPANTQWVGGPPAISGDTVRAPLRPLGPAAMYTIVYRIVSADGHPVSGRSTFTLTVPGTGTPAGPNSYSAGSLVSAASTESSPSPGGSAPVWPWIAGAGATLLLGLALARVLAHRP